MDTIFRVYVQTASLSGMPNRHELREGDVVSVRILSQTGQNSYIASFAGGKFSVTSERPLVPGSVFSASVSFSGTRVALSPLFKDTPFSPEHFVTTFSTAPNPDGTLSDAALVRYFASLNLPPDHISASLFAAMQSLGMKFDERIFNDARRIALSFPGREKEAAEAALLLEQKGIRPGKDAVAAVIGENEKRDKGSESNAASQNGERTESGGADGKSGGRAGGERAGGKREDGQSGGKNENISHTRPLSKETVSEIEAEVRRFFSSILSGLPVDGGRDGSTQDGGAESADTAGGAGSYEARGEADDVHGGKRAGRMLEQAEGGVLTLFNHRGFSSGATWIQLPFEISLDGGVKTGSGVLRFFVDVRQKKAEKCTATLDFGGQVYYFVIYLHKERGRVLYGTSFAPRADESAMLEKALEAAFAGKAFSVERAESGALSGFFEDGGISVVRGSV